MGEFWPHLPFVVPNSEGTSLAWEISWWVFQIVVMSGMLLMLTRWALRYDRRREQTGAMLSHEESNGPSMEQ